MSSELSAVPGQLRVTLPRIEIPGSPADEQLAGDYILSRVTTSRGLIGWSLRFEPQCGFERIGVSLVRADEGKWRMILRLTGRKGRVVWETIGTGEPAFPQDLSLKESSLDDVSWPESVSVTAIAGSSSGAAASLTDEPICPCPVANDPEPTVEIVVTGIANDENCDLCESFNGDLYTLEQITVAPPDMFCLFEAQLPYTDPVCEDALAYYEAIIAFDTTTCEIVYSFNVVGVAQHAYYEKTIPYKAWDPYALYTVDFQSAGTYACDFSGSSATMQYVPSPSMPSLDELECGNRPGVCKQYPVNLPVLGATGILTIECCCDEGCSEFCTAGEESVGCNAETCWRLDATAGRVNAQFSAPGFGNGSASLMVYLTTVPTDGTKASLLIDENLTELSTIKAATIKKCDHRQLYYVCRDSTSGQYESTGGNANTLVKNTDGTHTEKQTNGLEYDYDVNGLLYRIRNPMTSPTVNQPGSATWTITHDTGATNVTSPFGQRTTYSYDGNGHLKRIEDPDNRITSFSFTAGGLMTEHITPELCTSELRYNPNNYIESIVAPDGTRTTYAYDGGGHATLIQRPDGGRFTYVYLSRYKTTMTDPKGHVTTLLYDANRNVVGKITPLGNRTTYAYDWELLSSMIPPAGPRTTYTYKTLDQNVRMIEAKVTPTGRETYVYDTNNRHVATVDALGNRSSIVWSGSGQVASQVDPLNHRTTNVYATGGQPIASIDPLGNRSSLTYGTQLHIKSQINPLGYRTTYTYDMGQRTSSRNPLGQISTTLYDLSNRPVTSILPTGARTTLTYDSGGHLVVTAHAGGYRTTNVYSKARLVATVDAFAERTTMVYNSSGELIRTVSPLNEITTSVYDADGQQLAVVNALNNRTTTVYVSGRDVATVNPLSQRTTTVYGIDGNPAATINALSQRTTTLYDAVGRQKAIITGVGARTTMVYDAAGRDIATINPLGNRTTTVYDAADHPVATVNPVGSRSTAVYDAADRVVSSIDPLAKRTTTTYNAANNPVATINALNNRSTTVYSSTGLPIASIDALSKRTTTVYDSADRPLATINALNYRTTNVYDKSRQAASLNARGYRTTMIYDGDGRRVATVNALGHRTTTVYDAASQSVAAVNALGNRWTSVYDAAGRGIAQISPLLQRSTSVYDAAGRTVANIDGNNHRSTMVYDAAGREVAAVDALGNRTTTVYDLASQTTSLIDARGNRQSFTYDNAGRQTQQIDALARRTTLAYDAAGQQTLRIDARGNRTTYVYDAIGQGTGRRYPDGSRVTFAYDAARQRTQMQDLSGTYGFQYDGAGQTTVATNPQNTDNRLTYSYDPVGNRRGMHAKDSGRFTYSYDAVDQHTIVLNPFGERTSFSYDAAGQATVRRLSNGTRTSYIHDANGWRSNVDNRTSAGAAIETFAYQYDDAGNPITRVEADGDRTTWTYDDANRLLSERRSGASGYAHTFTYDAAGNRTLKNADAVRTTYVYDDANQLTYSQAAAGRTTYLFDANGNQRVEQPPASSRTTTTWDYENQPTLYRLPDASRVTLAYNADNRRVEKVTASGTAKFIWDPVADAYVSEIDGSNVLQATYTNPAGQFGSVISQRRSSTSHWFHPDSLGSTWALTNSSQTKSDTYLYDAWGNPLSSTGTTVNPFRWVGNVGYYFDNETGLYYIRARIYQPTIARWTSADPLFYMLAKDGLIGLGSNGAIGYAAGSICFYEYCHAKPIAYVDPRGMQIYVPIPPGHPRKPHQPTDPLKPGWPVPQDEPDDPWMPVPSPSPIPGAKGEFTTNCVDKLPGLTKQIGDACACLLTAQDLLSNHRDKIIDYYKNESASIHKDFILSNLDFYAPKIAFAAKGCSGDKGGCKLCFNCLPDCWGCPEGRLAYVNFYLSWRVSTCINICPAFFDLPPTGGTEETIIHEIGRFCGGISGSDNTGKLTDVYMWDSVLRSLCNNAASIRKRP